MSLYDMFDLVNHIMFTIYDILIIKLNFFRPELEEKRISIKKLIDYDEFAMQNDFFITLDVDQSNVVPSLFGIGMGKLFGLYDL